MHKIDRVPLQTHDLVDDVDEMRELVDRYQCRNILTEKIVEIYRKALQSLFADGRCYNSIPFNDLISSETEGSGWIEKEVSLIKACLSADNQLLEKICRNLHSRIRQLESYSGELRSRLEETLREVYRGGSRDEVVRGHMEALSSELTEAKTQVP